MSDTPDLPRDVKESALRLFEGLGCSRSLTLAILVRYREWDAIATMRCDPRLYDSAAAYASAAAATSFLRKCQDLPTSFDRRGNAEENFWRGESDCFKSNERLSRYLDCHNNAADRDPLIEDFFRRVRVKVYSWIGPGPRRHIAFRFGPGATYSDRGGAATVAHKMSTHPSLTRAAQRYLPDLMRSRWGSAIAAQARSLSYVKGNRFSVAPKDAVKDRCIASEPSVNISFQLGLGAQLRAGLKKHGIDLDGGQGIHAQVARESSIDRTLATLDLTNASDSISYNLVKLCLPDGWFTALASLRSPFTSVNGRWVMLEKFSSMGNGYTFELETLLFSAISCVSLEMQDQVLLPGVPARLGEEVYVYGDDIIVPRSGVKGVIAALRFCGLELNREKSFFQDEPFRESCGGDFFAGVPVRPFFLKEFPREPQEYIAMANGLRALASNLASPHGGAMVKRAWFFVLDQIPSHIRVCRGPKALGDIVIHDEEERWSSKTRHSIRKLRCYRPVRHRRVPYSLFHPSVVLACATYGLGWNNGGISPRDSVLGYAVAWVPFS